MRFIDPYIPTAQIAAIDCLDCRIRRGGILHLDERETTRTSRLTIGNQIDARHRSVPGEELPEFLLSRGKGNIPYV